MNTCRGISRRGSLGLAAIGGFSSLIPAVSVSAQPQPQQAETVHLPGIIRDFRQDHPDFNCTPPGGNGHYAANIEVPLGSDNRPVFEGDGFKVASQWRDKNTHPIAPHLFSDGGAVYVVNDAFKDNQSFDDTFDSSVGPYDPDEAGPRPTYVTGSPMPNVNEPTGLPFQKEFIYSGHGTTTLSSSFHCDKFLISDHRELQISGDVTAVVNEEFKIQNHGKIVLQPDATFTMYIKKEGTVQDQSSINMSYSPYPDPDRVTIYNLGIKEFLLQNQTHMYGTVVSPNQALKLQDGSHFYGKFTGKYVHLQNDAGLHIDGLPLVVCGQGVKDTAGTRGTNSTGGISSSETFEHWFRDMMGTNLSGRFTLELTKNQDGVFEYLEDEFFPIDGQLFGNENMPHNFFFTLALTADFTHHACDGRFFEFQGADDAWLFINNSLVIDLGGVIPGTEQYIDLDRLNLVDGEIYTLHFLYAQRNPTTAQFRLRTNLDLMVPDDETTVSAAFD